MGLGQKRTRVYSYILKGYTYEFIMDTFDCNVLFVKNILHLVKKSRVEVSPNVEKMLDTIKNDYPPEEYPELWL